MTRLFFRELDTIDAPPAGVAGRLFAANHWNGIVDPLLILTSARHVAAPIAKSTLFGTPGLRQLLALAGAVPVTRRKDAAPGAAVDNDAVFDRVAGHLARGGNILIFPEGVSHGEPHVLPLKTGAARMLARARAGGARGLTVQAVALDFDARGTFRSRAVVTYGPVREVDALADGGDDLVRAITDQLAADLSSLVIEGRSHGELQLVRATAEILAHEGPTRSAAEQVEVARQVVAQARALGPDDPRYQTVARAVGDYVAARRAVGLTEAQVARGQAPLDARRLLRGVGLALLAPLAIVGAALWYVPYRLPRLAERAEGDVVSTYKLGLGLVAFPIWAALLLAGAWWGVGGDLHQRLLHVALILVTPWAALRGLDRLDDRRGLRLLKTASTEGLRELARLRLLRGRALEAIEAARGSPQDRGAGEGQR